MELVSTPGSLITKLRVCNELGAQVGWGLLLETSYLAAQDMLKF